MGNIIPTYLPPQNWQDFEKLLKGLVDVIWAQEGWQFYGRTGQNQSGIDLFGYDEEGRFTAIQCKKVSLTNSDGQLLSNSLLTEKIIRTEIENAEKIDEPKIERLIFATTSSRDVKIQNIIRGINHIRKNDSKFIIDIWFWEDIQIYIEKHIPLMNFYYSEMLEKINKYDPNIHILSLFRQAFTRPAFKREIAREESGADFIEAIKGTMEAITTGKLYNRRNQLIATSHDYQKLTKPNWKKSIKEINDNLDEIRNIYQQGIIDKTIIEHQSCLEVLDDKISAKFNSLRTESLIKMNLILNEAGLELIESELIQK
ncbi:hypothetical protein [Flavobacterium sp. FlaQc-48]|uniref:restriction endonuclease n=1 Tax=Flavobacterium sp. FlaQc-48 TaxID=3374181 RepID=UPI003757ABA3